MPDLRQRVRNGKHHAALKDGTISRSTLLAVAGAREPSHAASPFEVGRISMAG